MLVVFHSWLGFGFNPIQYFKKWKIKTNSGTKKEKNDLQIPRENHETRGSASVLRITNANRDTPTKLLKENVNFSVDANSLLKPLFYLFIFCVWLIQLYVTFTYIRLHLCSLFLLCFCSDPPLQGKKKTKKKTNSNNGSILLDGIRDPGMPGCSTGAKQKQQRSH